MGSKWVLRWLPIALGLTMAGCASAPFYNESRDKQGQAVTKAVGSVDLVAVVDDLSKKYTALAENETATLQARLATSRDIEIARVASTTGDQANLSLRARYVEPLLEHRLKQLVGSLPPLGELGSLLQNADTAEVRGSQALSAIRSFAASSGLDIQDCAAIVRLATTSEDGSLELSRTALEAIPSGKRQAARALFKNAAVRCGTEVESGAIAHQAGLIKELSSQLKNEAGLASAYRRGFQKQQDLLAAQAGEFARQEAAISPLAADLGYRARLILAAEKLGSAIELLSKVAGEDALAQAHVDAQAKLDALEAFTGALASGVSDPTNLSDGQRQALAIVRLIPTVADEADKLLKGAQRPRLAPFLIAKEHQRLLVEGFQKYVKLLDRRVATRERQLQLAMLELKAVAGARLALGPPQGNANGPTVNIGQPMAATVSDGTPAERYALYQSFARYFDEAYRYRVEQEALGLNVLAMSYDLEIEKSRTAAQMWQSLMTNMASTVADFHAAGLKLEPSELLKALGLFYIGARAAR